MTEDEMKRRIHTMIATLLAVLCVSAAVAPMASAAKAKPQNPTIARICAELQDLFEHEKAQMIAAQKAGNEELANSYADDALETWAIADRADCRWTRTRVAPTESDFGPTVVPVVLDVR
jgi:hypothetical protein